MRTVCEKDMCAGCMACIDICTHNAITIQDDVKAYNAIIDVNKCVNCGLCERVCQQNHPATMREPFDWRQGWAVGSEERATSSSGGAAAAISKAFVEHGGVVCSCAFRDGQFGFEIAENEESLRRFKGSKYVKSNPIGAYHSVRSFLRRGQKVLFIGLPCQISSMRNYCNDNENLYTVDLICHGTPSPKILEKFLAEYGIDIREASNICFRKKTSFALYDEKIKVEVPGVTDRYSIAFLNGLDYTENCYSCTYACRNRVSDITLGDSWGTDLSDESAAGVSLILCQTDKGEQLLKLTDMKLMPLDLNVAISNNAQLVCPSKMPRARERFLMNLNKGVSVRHSILLAFPRQCLKQGIKKVLIRHHLWKKNTSTLVNQNI